MERMESLFATIGETDPSGKAMNPLWAAVLEKVEEAWHSSGLFLTLPPLHPFYKLSGALLRLLICLSLRDREVY